MYDTLKKFADRKGIKATKMAEKDAYKAGKKGKNLTATELKELQIQMARDLGYLD